MAQAYYYSNSFVPGTIGNSGGISSAATSFYLADTPSGVPAGFPFKLVLDPGNSLSEIVVVTSGSGTEASPWAITRGWDGSTASGHSAGAAVQHDMTQEDLALSRLHESYGSGSGVHGLPAAAWLGGSLAVIQEVLLATSTSALITFSSIPQNYAHLLVVVQGRSTSAGAKSCDVTCTLNADASAKYSYLTYGFTSLSGSLEGAGPTAASATTGWANFIEIAASQAGSSVNAGGGFALLPNYSGTAQNKQFLAVSGMGDGTDSYLTGRIRWGYYNPATQTGISTLSLACAAGNFQSGTFAGLYALGS